METPVLNIDIAPTLLELAGVTTGAEKDMDGLSVVPLVNPNATDVPHVTSEISRKKRSSELTNNTSLEGAVPIINNYTGIQGRHNFLVEYSGEGEARTDDQACAAQLHSDLDNLSQCSQTFGCKCQDARNNTYTCLREGFKNSSSIDKGRHPIEKVPNFREFSRKGGGSQKKVIFPTFLKLLRIFSIYL